MDVQPTTNGASGDRLVFGPGTGTDEVLDLGVVATSTTWNSKEHHVREKMIEVLQGPIEAQKLFGPAIEKQVRPLVAMVQFGAD